MRRPRQRPMHYLTTGLYDGTIMAAYPVRKPVPKIIKRDRLTIDDDGVCTEYMNAGMELSDVDNEGRTRFQDIIAARLNTRRAIREMVVPHLLKMQKDMDDMHTQLDEIRRLLTETHMPPTKVT